MSAQGGDPLTELSTGVTLPYNRPEWQARG